MNPTLVVALWRQRLTSPIRVVLLAMAFGFPLLTVAFTRGSLTMLGDSTGLVLIFAVGMIGQDLSSGVLQLLFARPVRRFEYVVSRWIAVGAAASAIGLAQAGLGFILLGARGAAPPVNELMLFAAQRVLGSFGIAAVFALLSSVIGGVGDLALFFAGFIIGQVVVMVAGAKGWTVLTRAGQEFQAFLMPDLDLPRLLSASTIPLFPIASYLSSVALALALAVWVMNRKELSYASS